MQRRHLMFTACLTLLVTFFTLVSPVFAQGQRSIQLVSVNHWGSKGVVIKFEVTGDFSPTELQGFVQIGDHQFPLDCSFNDEGLLVCVAGGGIGAYAGQSVIVVLNGQGFYANIPVKKEFGSGLYCYPIEGLMTDDIEAAVVAMGELGPEALSYWYPAQVGIYCTETPPQNFEQIDFEHPYESQLEEFFPFGGPFGGDITIAIFLDENAPLLDGETPDGCVIQPAYNAYMRLMLCLAERGT